MQIIALKTIVYEKNLNNLEIVFLVYTSKNYNK